MSSAIPRRNSLRTRLFLQALEDRRTPATFTVNSLLDDGSGVGNAGTLRFCINEANALPGADTIDFSVTGTITLGGTQLPNIFSAGGKLDILGPGASQVTIDANKLSRIFEIDGGAIATIEGLTITGGSVTGNGGGIENFGSLTLKNAIVTNNVAGFGAGIHSWSTLSVTNSTLSGNVASTYGGAIYSKANASLTLTNSTVSGNSALSDGGGMLVNGGTPTNIVNSTLSGNSSSVGGGAIYSNYGQLSILNSTITNNVANNGGGIHTRFNIAVGSLAVTSSIISGNNAGTGPDINLWNGTADVNFSAIGSSAGFAMTGSNNLPFGAILKLGTLTNNGGPTETHLPAIDSPLLNAGSNPLALATDQRGRPRVTDGQADIGSVEFSKENKSLVVTTTSDVSDDFDDLTSLREAVDYSNTLAGADTVSFDPTVFASAQTITLGGTQLTFTDSTGETTIAGTGADQLTIDANKLSRVFQVSGTATVTINGVTVSGGSVAGSSGGIRNSGTLTLTNSAVSGNTADFGGGISNLGTMTVSNSTFSNNTALVFGGAIEIAGVSTTFTNVTVAGNVALSSAGINFLGGTLSVTNSTITGNSGTGVGGGYSGGLYLIDNGSGQATFINTIVANNSSPNAGNENFAGPGTLVNSFNNLIGTGGSAGLTDGVNGNIVGVANPLLGTLGNYGGTTQTIPLLSGSPAISAGTSVGAPTTDQRGFLRHSPPDIGAFEAFQESLVVTTTADEDDGTSDPLFGTGTSLREAINYANANAGADTVTFDATLFASAQTITLGGTQITFTDTTGATTVAGTGVAKLTVDGDAQSRIFGVDSSVTVTINGVTISNGSATGDGGGIYNAGSLTITNSVVSGNFASSDGGGIYSDNGTLSVSDSTITGNSADGDGGGIYSYSGSASITNSTVSGNSAGSAGGGLYIYNGSMTVTNSTISGNSANSEGGGLYNYDGFVTVTNSTIAGNSSGSQGGGIAMHQGVTTITTSTLSGNTAGDGGGIASNFGDVTIVNSTISGNSASDDGGGIYNYSADVNVANSIVAGNTASASKDIDGSATVTFSLISDTVGLSFETGSSDNFIDPNPLLGPLGNYGGATQTVPLLPGSPAIDAGSTTVTLDQRGQSRFGTPDIGAFESQGFKYSATSGSGQSAKINAAFTNPLTVTVTANNAIEPVDGGVVTFIVPVSGASASLANANAVITGGKASTTAKANGNVGTYNVTASATGVAGTASFSLTNLTTGTYAVGTGAGISSKVTVYDNVTNAVKFTITPFVSSFLGGVRVATGDVNGDGILDIIAAAGPGGGPHVKVFDGNTGTQLPGPIGSFFAYNSNFKGGVFVAAGDVDGDSKADVITGAGAGGGPHVIAFNGATGSLLTSFFAYNANFTGGVSVAAGDIAGDTKAEIITGAGAGGGPHVATFDGAGKQLQSFFAYGASFSGGVFVAAGDINGDGKDDIITGSGAGGGPHVKVFDGTNLALLRSFFAYGASFSGGVRVASSNFGDLTDGIITGAGAGGSPHVKVFNADLTQRASFFADPVTNVHGVYVG